MYLGGLKTHWRSSTVFGLLLKNGFQLIPSSRFMVEGPIQAVKKTWRERLFSWPWRPWDIYRAIKPAIPDPKVYIVPEWRAILGHPAILQNIVEEIESVQH